MSVGIAALTATGFNTATIDAANTVVRALVEHRDDSVKTRAPNRQSPPCTAHPPHTRCCLTGAYRRPRRQLDIGNELCCGRGSVTFGFKAPAADC